MKDPTNTKPITSAAMRKAPRARMSIRIMTSIITRMTGRLIQSEDSLHRLMKLNNQIYHQYFFQLTEYADAASEETPVFTRAEYLPVVDESPPFEIYGLIFAERAPPLS